MRIEYRLKINFFTPSPTLLRRSGYAKARGSKLIFFAPLGAGVNEENQLLIAK
jgi:hypothetical protein